jgi:ubiquinone/menaquinone biosynthesis C-methylase UbiE
MTETPSFAGAYTYEAFASHPFYEEINASLVRMAIGRLDRERPKGERVQVVEVASGTGAVTELILNQLERLGRPASVTGVEPSFEANDVARERLRGREVSFIQGDANDLARLVSNVDAAFFCNAIHLVPDKEDAIRKVAAALAPGGLFAFNSSFFDGAYAPGSERFYRLWVRRALGWIRERYPEVRPNRNEKALAMQWLNEDQYTQLAAGAGMRVVDRTLEVAEIPVRALQDMGRYWLFIDGALPGVPIDIGADALEYAAGEAGAELGVTSVPRYWLQMVTKRDPALA